MKQILKIGHETMVLPMTVNLNTLLQTLAKSQSARCGHDNHEEYFHLEGAPRIEIKVVDDKHVVDPKKRKALPEQAGGPYDNTF